MGHNLGRAYGGPVGGNWSLWLRHVLPTAGADKSFDASALSVFWDIGAVPCVYYHLTGLAK